MALRTALGGAVLLLVCGLVSGPASAGQKTAVFPFDLDVKPKEEDFYSGESKPSPEEEARLKLVRAEFVERLAADGRYEAVDLSGLATEIEAAQSALNEAREEKQNATVQVSTLRNQLAMIEPSLVSDS